MPHCAVMCTTAAHSTVGLDNQNSTSLRTGRIANVSNVEVGEARGGILAVATHDGFDASHGILHHRKLIVRFHLHPKVAAAMLSSGAVLLKIRGSRAGWTLKAQGAHLEIGNSTYFEDWITGVMVPRRLWGHWVDGPQRLWCHSVNGVTA